MTTHPVSAVRHRTSGQPFRPSTSEQRSTARNHQQSEGGDLHLAGIIETDVEVVREPKSASGELVDVVTEATWNDALSQLGGLPSNPLPLWMMLATRILRAVADGERDPQLIKNDQGSHRSRSSAD